MSAEVIGVTSRREASRTDCCCCRPSEKVNSTSSRRPVKVVGTVKVAVDVTL